MVQIISFLKKKNGCWLPHPKFLFAPGCYRGDGPLSTTVSCFGVSRCTVSNVHACHTLHGRPKEWARCKKRIHFHDGRVWLLPMKIQAWVSDPAVLVSGRNPRSPFRALTLMMSVPFFFSNLDFFFFFFATSRGFQHPSYSRSLEDLRNNHCKICTHKFFLKK